MHVLIIEDNEKLAKSLKKGFEKNGFAADVILNGEEAVEHLILNYQDYDAVVLDLMLPGRSGTDICATVRERQIMTPIIILTATDQTASKLTLLDAGADDYMVKPFSLEELIARVRALTRRPTELVPTELVFESIRLLPTQHKVFVDTAEITLTVKEFAILELFLRNQGQVLSREFILDHVWDHNFNSMSNIVDVHVKNLRKKLETAEAGDHIHTISGVGYRLSP